jgi:Lrp/AsnC family leucine-responsive transcriptional regulator
MPRSLRALAIDNIDRKIIELLLVDARTSIKDLAKSVKLSAPSVSERVQRLQERGVIRRFTVDIDPASLGYDLQALVRIKPLPGKLQVVEKLIQDIPEFSECFKVTGNDCFIARLHFYTISQLDEILDRIARVAELNTSIVKAQPVRIGCRWDQTKAATGLPSDRKEGPNILPPGIPFEPRRHGEGRVLFKKGHEAVQIVPFPGR